MTQSEALDLIMMGNNVYLTGQAGSGKTYLLNKYIDFLKHNKIPVAVTATTGIAATHLNGQTIHSWSGIGIKNELTEREVLKIASDPIKATIIRETKVLIIDEISMLHSYRLDLINRICKIVRQNEQPFGNLQVILCGDFFQLPPINETGYSPSSFAFKAAAWQETNFEVLYLDEQHRQWDESFLKVLNDIRSSDISEATFEKLKGRLNMTIPSEVYPTKLYTHNTDVDAINNLELSKINKSPRSFEMVSKGKKELVAALKKGCLSPEVLTLKVDALVMFVKNNLPRGYINGTLGKVINFDSDGNPIVLTHAGKKIVASPVSWGLEENDKVVAQISQVPLRLAWAITVHKSQGMSLDAAEIDLSKSFAYGMGYVALSRVRSLSGIRLLGINNNAFLVDGEISRADLEFIKLSRQVSLKLKQSSIEEIKSKQKEFLKTILPANSKPNSVENIMKDLFTKFFGN